MDPLTRMLEATRARSPLLAELHLGSDVSLGLPHLPAIPFHYVLEGECQIHFGSRFIPLRVGDLVMLPRWPDYRIETGKGLERIEISDIAARQSVPANYLRVGVGRPLKSVIGGGLRAARILSGVVSLVGHNGPITRGLPEVTLVHDAGTRIEPWLVAATEFLSAEGSAPEPGFGAVAERLVDLIFIVALRNWMLQDGRDTKEKQRLTDSSVSLALDAMHANPARQWTLRDLATVSGRSRSGFAERFRAVMGETPFVYLVRWRMHAASGLIREGHLSTADIGVSLGYRSLNGFACAFFDAFGETPAQHRRRSRQAVTDESQ